MGTGQKTTFSQALPTEADRIAQKERSRERARLLDAERQAALKVAGMAELERAAVALALEKEKERASAPVDTEAAEAEAAAHMAQRAEGEARLEELSKAHARAISLFYSRMQKLLDGLNEDRDTITEARGIAARLGVSNPAAASVMQIGESAGLNLSKAAFAQAVFEKFMEHYAKNSAQVLAGPFEGVRGKSKATPLATEEVEKLAHQERKRELPAVTD